MVLAIFRVRRPSETISTGLLALAPVGLSFVFACATPFAALGTLAASRMRRRDALAVVAIAWLANQVIGFAVLHYPHTASTVGWGLAIGVAAVVATLAAGETAHRLLDVPARLRLLGWLLPLGSAFGAYEAALFAATWLLPSGPGAFAPNVIARLLTINVATYVAFAAVRYAARLLRPATEPAIAA